jgi:hypothetical protein
VRIPRYTRGALSAAFPATQTAVSSGSPNVIPFLLGPKPAHITNSIGADINANAQANWPSWFELLTPEQMNNLLREIFKRREINDIAHKSRKEWLDILFALGHAERLGATAACEIAELWSKTSNKFNRADFDRSWRSFDPTRGRGVGTLIYVGERAGLDFDPWRDLANGVPAGSGSKADAGTNTFFKPVRFDATYLEPVPWLVSNMLIRGEITVLAGQGGSAKTAVMICIAVALAAARSSIGPFTICTREGGLRAAILSGEEDPNRISLLVAGACAVQGLSASERAMVRENLMVHDARESGWRLGEPRPDKREEIMPEGQGDALENLQAGFAEHQPDVLMMDTFSTLLALPTENDNSLITGLMNRLGRAARQANCAVMVLHHVPKMTRVAAAEQRGEPTLVRGGTAIVNTARIVHSLTSLPQSESALFDLNGLHPDAIRRLDPVKVNDAPMTAPSYIRLVSIQVMVSDGSRHAVRAVDFIALPHVSSGGISDAHRNLAMKAIDAGAIDDAGARVPLSPNSGGRSNKRDPVEHIAQAFMNAQQGLSENYAKTAARELLKGLLRIGCVVDEEVQVPRYKIGGAPNGTRKVRGLVTRWDLAPWVTATPVNSATALDSPPRPIGAEPNATSNTPAEMVRDALSGLSPAQPSGAPADVPDADQRTGYDA